jgi:hypothetical protein
VTTICPYTQPQICLFSIAQNTTQFLLKLPTSIQGMCMYSWINLRFFATQSIILNTLKTRCSGAPNLLTIENPFYSTQHHHVHLTGSRFTAIVSTCLSIYIGTVEIKHENRATHQLRYSAKFVVWTWWYSDVFFKKETLVVASLKVFISSITRRSRSQLCRPPWVHVLLYSSTTTSTKFVNSST